MKLRKLFWACVTLFAIAAVLFNPPHNRQPVAPTVTVDLSGLDMKTPEWALQQWEREGRIISNALLDYFKSSNYEFSPHIKRVGAHETPWWRVDVIQNGRPVAKLNVVVNYARKKGGEFSIGVWEIYNTNNFPYEDSELLIAI